VIEVNLLPQTGKGKKGPRKKRSLSLPAFKGMPGDRWVVGAGTLAFLALVFVGWLFIGVAGEAEELEVQIEAAQRDSARFADVIRRSELLRAQSDSIQVRLVALQEIDGARYVWPHLMDEVGRALPNFTWLVRFSQVQPAPNLSVRIQGRAATYFALTTFMENLEASPFIQGVRLIASNQVMMQVPGSGNRPVYAFELEARWQDPPPEAIDMAPLFGASVAIPGGSPDAPTEDR
jgi:Tfp pilus assembly protein PilN